MPGNAWGRWPNGSEAQLRRYWPDVQAAADAAGISDHADVLAAICIHETGMRAVRGGVGRRMWGACQVNWRVWGDMLRTHGLDDRRQLVGKGAGKVPAGLYAGALVLADLHVLQWLDIAPALCAYGVGWRGREWTGCTYSFDVMANVDRVHLIVRRMVLERWLLRGAIVAGCAAGVGACVAHLLIDRHGLVR